MKFLKQIFGLNGRLDRRGYLLFGVLPMIGDGYLKKSPKDVWGTPIIYVKTKDGFELISYGADRKEGGEDDGAYVFSDDFENPQEIITYLQEINNDFKNQNIHLEVLDETFYQSLIDFYRNMDDETKETIGLCEIVAGGNLYCGYCEKFTNEALIELLNRTDMWRNFDFYKIAKFYPFSCDDKWGKKFKFNDFKRK